MSYLRVEAVRLDFRRGGTVFRALSDISLEVPRGSTFGIVGESGSGKSTLVRLISGSLASTSGQVLIDGHDVRALRPRQRAQLVQMVFQDPYGALHPRFTVDRTLSEPLRIHGVEGIAEQVRTALDRVRLPASIRFRFPNELSGGQRQRVAIARSLMLRPSLLLLDEPTSALDVSIQAEILNLLADIRQEQGLTCVLVSHDLAVVAHLCETVGMMRQGRLIEVASAADFASGQLQETYSRELVETALAFEDTEVCQDA